MNLFLLEKAGNNFEVNREIANLNAEKDNVLKGELLKVSGAIL
jgi:hypothetical protein